MVTLTIVSVEWKEEKREIEWLKKKCKERCEHSKYRPVFQGILLRYEAEKGAILGWWMLVLVFLF